MADGHEPTPAEILTFWREAGRDRWYERDDAFDAEVRSRYLGLWRKANAGELSPWEASDDGALALTIVLDQFPRNMFRGGAEAFASDAKAREVAGRAIARGADGRIEPVLLEFLYMPFMHSENLPTSSAAWSCSEAQSRQPQICRATRRHHPPVRALPASQPRAGTRNDSRKNRPFWRRRIFRLMT